MCVTQDQLSASLRWYGTPSPLAIVCLLFAMLLVNALCYTFLLQIIYRVLLGVSRPTDTHTHTRTHTHTNGARREASYTGSLATRADSAICVHLCFVLFV